MRLLRIIGCTAFCMGTLAFPALAQQDETREEMVKEAKKKDKAYRDKLAESLADLKELERAAKEAFDAGDYREASEICRSIILADIPDEEKAVSTAIEITRRILIEMEHLAQAEIRKAEDAVLARNYIKAIGHLSVVMSDFSFTKARATAENRLLALRSDKTVAADIAFAECEAVEASGDLAKAVSDYQRLIENPRYEGTAPVLKAKTRIELLKTGEATRDALKAQMQAVADKEAPPILNTAKNFLMNNQPGSAKEKFQSVIDKYPGTSYAEEAQREIEFLK